MGIAIDARIRTIDIQRLHVPQWYSPKTVLQLMHWFLRYESNNNRKCEGE